MKPSALILLTLICFISLLGRSSGNRATDVIRRQVRVGKAVASLFENQQQSPRDLQETIMQDEDDKVNEMRAEPTKFRMRRLKGPNYVELIE